MTDRPASNGGNWQCWWVIAGFQQRCTSEECLVCSLILSRAQIRGGEEKCSSNYALVPPGIFPIDSQYSVFLHCVLQSPSVWFLPIHSKRNEHVWQQILLSVDQWIQFPEHIMRKIHNSIVQIFFTSTHSMVLSLKIARLLFLDVSIGEHCSSWRY